MAEEVPTPYRNPRAYTALQHHPHHCPDCARPWGMKSQVSHKCEYCNHRLNWKETPTIKKLIWLFWDFMPIIIFIALGFIACAIMGVHYSG